MDIKTSVQALISPALEYCQKHGYGLLIGTDTNAHHTDWGLSTNDRGRELEAIIDNYNLVIHNRGRLPTYECKLGSSIIDVTLSSRLPMRVDNWRVNRSFNGSDHNTIQFQLVIDTIELPEHRNYDKADWGQFQEELKQINFYTPTQVTQKKLDKMVNKITYSINKATENCCPTLPAKLINKNNPWWTPQMADLRKEVTALYRRTMKNNCERIHDNYKKVLRKYKNLCLKAKDKHRKRTNEIIPDEAKMAKYAKSMSEQLCPQIGSVIKPDGSNSLIGKDTHDVIINTHFPQHSPCKQTRYNNDIKLPYTNIHPLFTTWLSNDKISLALNSFKDKKIARTRRYEANCLQALPRQCHQSPTGYI